MKPWSEVLVEILEAYGIDTAFGIPGVHTVELYRGPPGHETDPITPRATNRARGSWRTASPAPPENRRPVSSSPAFQSSATGCFARLNSPA